MRMNSKLFVAILLMSAATAVAQVWNESPYEVAPDLESAGTPFWNEAFDPAADGRWWVPQSFTGQLVWLGRTRSSEESLLVSRGELNPITLAIDHTPAIYASDFNLPAKVGARGSVLFGKVDGWQFEVAYLGVFDQQSTLRFAEPVDEVGIYFFDSALFTPDTDFTVSYESDLHTAECNLWCEDGCYVQGLIGARWFQQSEELEQFQTLDIDDRALTEIRNNLVGGQLGFRANLVQRGRWSIIGIAKGGIYANDVRMSGDVTSGGATISAINATDRTTSYAGELNLTCVWQWTPWFNLHFGYTGLWLTQVATLGDQFNNFSVAGTGAFEYESTSYQGGHFGLTLAW